MFSLLSINTPRSLSVEQLFSHLGLGACIIAWCCGARAGLCTCPYDEAIRLVSACQSSLPRCHFAFSYLKRYFFPLFFLLLLHSFFYFFSQPLCYHKKIQKNRWEIKLEKSSVTVAIISGHWLELRSRCKEAVPHHHQCILPPPLREFPCPTLVSFSVHSPLVQLLVLQADSVVLVKTDFNTATYESEGRYRWCLGN